MRPWLLSASAISLGLLSGAMLFIAVALMTAWRATPPVEFTAWFAAHNERIGALMLPLGFVSLALAALAAAVSWRTGPKAWSVLAAGAALAVIVTYPLFFAETNARFIAGGLPETEVQRLLSQWAAWHWARTVAGLIGFVAAVLALRRRDPVTPIKSS